MDRSSNVTDIDISTELDGLFCDKDDNWEDFPPLPELCTPGPNNISGLSNISLGLDSDIEQLFTDLPLGDSLDDIDFFPEDFQFTEDFKQKCKAGKGKSFDSKISNMFNNELSANHLPADLEKDDQPGIGIVMPGNKRPILGERYLDQFQYSNQTGWKNGISAPAQDPKLVNNLLSFPQRCLIPQQAPTVRMTYVIPQLSDSTLGGILMQSPTTQPYSSQSNHAMPKTKKRNLKLVSIKREEAKRRKRNKGKFCKEKNNQFVPITLFPSIPCGM